MTDNEIIKALDGADVFLRNRANSKPAPLNEYDIEALIDIANVCDEAANLINRQKAEIERLEKTVEDMTEGCQIAIKVSENEAIRRFSYRLRAECGSYDTGHYIFHEDEIHNLVKEMAGGDYE